MLSNNERKIRICYFFNIEDTKIWLIFLADSINWYRKGQVGFAEERVTTINLARVVMSLLKLGIGVYN